MHVHLLIHRFVRRLLTSSSRSSRWLVWNVLPRSRASPRAPAGGAVWEGSGTFRGWSFAEGSASPGAGLERPSLFRLCALGFRPPPVQCERPPPALAFAPVAVGVRALSPDAASAGASSSSARLRWLPGRCGSGDRAIPPRVEVLRSRGDVSHVLWKLLGRSREHLCLSGDPAPRGGLCRKAWAPAQHSRVHGTRWLTVFREPAEGRTGASDFRGSRWCQFP